MKRLMGVILFLGVMCIAATCGGSTSAPVNQNPTYFQTDGGISYAGKLIQHARNADSPGARVTCKQAEKALAASDDPDQVEDWNILVDACNDIFSGDFLTAIAYLNGKVSKS